MTPGFATFMTCGVGLFFYLSLTAISNNVLADTVNSISLAIAFYYGLTCFSCVWCFRKDLFISTRNFLLVFPVDRWPHAGTCVHCEFNSSVQPRFRKYEHRGNRWCLVVGVGSLLFGIVVMTIWQLWQPAFFHGETLRRDTPTKVPNF